MFSIVSTKVKLKLIEITFCWLIVALSRVKEGRLMACALLSGISGIDVLVGEVQQRGVVTAVGYRTPAEECFYVGAALENYSMQHMILHSLKAPLQPVNCQK